MTFDLELGVTRSPSMLDIETIESLFNKYANIKASSVLISEVFITYMAIRPIEILLENILGFKDRKKILAREVGNK